MVKRWLAALGKLILEFLVLLVFLSAAGAFAATLDAPSAGALGLAALHQSLVEWPLALALALTTGIVSFAAAPARSPLRLLSVALVGLAMAATGTVARDFDWPTMARSQVFPLAGQAVENGDRLASASAIEGSRVRGLVTIDWSKAMPRLSWRSSAPFDANTSSAIVGSTRWSLVPAWESLDSPISIGLPFLDSLKPPLSRVEGEGFWLNLARALGFVILCVGLGSLSLRFHFPVTSLLVALIAALVAVAIDSSAIAVRLPSIIASLSSAPGFALGSHWMLPGAEALLGIAVAAIGLVMPRGARE